MCVCTFMLHVQKSSFKGETVARGLLLVSFLMWCGSWSAVWSTVKVCEGEAAPEGWEGRDYEQGAVSLPYNQLLFPSFCFALHIPPVGARRHFVPEVPAARQNVIPLVHFQGWQEEFSSLISWASLRHISSYFSVITPFFYLHFPSHPPFAF